MSQSNGITEWFELGETLKTVWFQPSCRGWGHLHQKSSDSVLGFCTRTPLTKPPLCTLHPHIQPEKQHKENSTHRNTNYS